jgi:hypothetical protein
LAARLWVEGRHFVQTVIRIAVSPWLTRNE